MVTTSQLRKKIAKEKARISREQLAIQDRRELKRLQKEFAELKSPGKRRTSEALRRTGRGLKVIGKGVLNQARLIKEQQLRDQAISRKQELELTKLGSKKKFKGKGGRKVLKSFRKASKKVIQEPSESIFKPLDF